MNIQNIANEILNTRIITMSQVLIRNKFLKRAKTLQEILDATSARSIKYQDHCQAKLVRANTKRGRWAFKVKCGEKWSKGPYDIRFKLLLKGKRTRDIMKRQIEISCNCNAWQFNGADYNAMNKNYSERQYSDGTAPNKRDRRRKFLMCKHVAACIPIFSDYIIPKGYK